MRSKTESAKGKKAKVMNLSATDGLASFSLLPAGDLGLRPAGAGHEVHRPAHAGAPDVPDAPEHDAALCQAQPPHQHVPVRPEKRQGPAVGGESSVIFKHEAGVESGGPGNQFSVGAGGGGDCPIQARSRPLGLRPLTAQFSATVITTHFNSINVAGLQHKNYNM